MQQTQEKRSQVSRASAFPAEWIKRRLITWPGSTLVWGHVSGGTIFHLLALPCILKAKQLLNLLHCIFTC